MVFAPSPCSQNIWMMRSLSSQDNFPIGVDNNFKHFVKQYSNCCKNQTIICLQNIKHLTTKTITSFESFPLSWYSASLQSKLIAEQSKLETVKIMGARNKINAISLNVQINKRKSVDLCGYKLPINVQNVMQKDTAQAKISSKVVGGYFFGSPCRA